MFLNIITPCSRPDNLKIIEDSINIPKENYKWIIVFDNPAIPNNIYIPKYCETYFYQEKGSIVGHAQRNYALSLIDHGHIYFNDDDTVIHPNLWENIKSLDDMDFISFDQQHKNGQKRLCAGNIKKNHVDSHNFIVAYHICKDIKFHIDNYAADGVFAEETYAKSKKYSHINKILSTYNALRYKNGNI